MKQLIGTLLDKILFRTQDDTDTPSRTGSKKEKLKIFPALPHGEIKPVLENTWFVTGQVKMPMLFPPMKISRSMTIIKNPESSELTLVNTMRLSEEGLKELEKLGTVTNVLRIAGFHGRDDAFYKQRYGATVFALKGHVYTREMMKPVTDPNVGYLQPDVWLSEGDPVPVSNASLKWFHSSSPIEAILVLDQDGGVLVTGDSLQNTPHADEYNNWAAKILMNKMGFFKAYNVGTGWVQFAKPTLADIRSILDLDFDHVLPGHGGAVIGNAKEKYRPVLEGEIRGCHE